MKGKVVLALVGLGAVCALAVHCIQGKQVVVPPPGEIARESAIPAGARVVTPEEDAYPPVVHLEGWEQPVSLGPPVNTAGVEDSPFILPEGNTLYFFFTPDINKPPARQIADGVSGIYVSHRDGAGWGVPERVVLQDPGKLALDGCPFVLGDRMCFCSARAGNFRDMDLWWAEGSGGRWGNWVNAGKLWNETYRVGEMHMTADGKQLFFASDRPGGRGKLDLWVSEYVGGRWQEPVNLWEVNTEENENQPFVTEDGRELWFTRRSGHLPGAPGVYRSVLTEKGWSRPEEVISHFAGEPSLDREGNIYFVHPLYSKRGRKLGADIYVARKKPPPAVSGVKEGDP